MITSFIAFSASLATLVVALLKTFFLTIAATPNSWIITALICTGLLLFQIPYLGSVAVLPYIYIGNFLTFLGLSRKAVTWSVVYDSVTKLPIDPAYVTVRDMQGREVSSLITDLNGRFALLLPRGLYTIEASKTNYNFPSTRLLKDTTDGKYSNLYFGSVIEIDDRERSIGLSIPMDPIQEDWNQTQKKRHNLFYRFDDKKTYFQAARIYSLLALVVTAIRTVIHPTLNMFHLPQITVLVFIIVLLYTRRHSQYAHSFVVDKHTGEPMAFAKVNIFSNKTRNKVAQKETSFQGQFTCLVSRGEYYLTIERRNQQGGHDLVYTSPVFAVHDGYIGKRFDV